MQRRPLGRRASTARSEVALRAVGLLVIVIALACSRRGEPVPSASASSASAPVPPRGFRIDGEPFAPAAILATGTEGEASWRLTVAPKPMTCDDLAASYPEHPKEDGALDFWLVEPVGRGGSREPWAYRSGHELTASGARSLVARGAMLDGVTVNEDRIAVKGLELSLQTRGPNPRLYQHDGDLIARRCPRVRRPEAAHPQPKLTLTLDGESVAIRGATLRDEGGKVYLRLTRAPHRCDSVFTEGFDFYLDLALVGSPLKVSHVALLGGAFPESATGSKGKETFVVDAPALGAAPRDVTMRVDGTLDAGGYAVAMKGEVVATRCVVAPK